MLTFQKISEILKLIIQVIMISIICKTLPSLFDVMRLFDNSSFVSEVFTIHTFCEDVGSHFFRWIILNL